MSDGTVLAWGSNAYGELGDGTRESRTEAHPVMVRGPGGRGYLDRVILVASGATGLSRVMRNDWSDWEWGENPLRDNGHPEAPGRFFPTEVDW